MDSVIASFTPVAQDLIRRVVACFSPLPQVEAIALGGSRQTGFAEPGSDLDFYIYTQGEIPLDTRWEIGRRYSERPEVDNSFWGPGDEWRDGASGLIADLIYFSPQFMEDQVDRAVIHHLPSVGYSTAFWHTVRVSLPLYDRAGWFARLQAKADLPYPEPLRRAIVANNHPILRHTLSAYARQVEKAVQRQDRVSLNHRVAALVASYFDILFAVNYVPHPGEKRLVAWAERLCPLRPDDMACDLEALILAVAAPWDAQPVLNRINTLLNGLDRLLIAEGLLDESGTLLRA